MLEVQHNNIRLRLRRPWEGNGIGPRALFLEAVHELVGLLRVEVDLVVWVRIVSVGHVDVVGIRRKSVGQEGHGVDQ